MLNAIPGMDHLARVCVCVSLCGRMRKRGTQMIWEYLNGRACELGCGRDMRNPAVPVCCCTSAFKRETRYYDGNSSVLKVDVRDLGAFVWCVCVCAYTLESQQYMLMHL